MCRCSSALVHLANPVSFSIIATVANTSETATLALIQASFHRYNENSLEFMVIDDPTRRCL
jgi:hypothetical protein